MESLERLAAQPGLSSDTARLFARGVRVLREFHYLWREIEEVMESSSWKLARSHHLEHLKHLQRNSPARNAIAI